MIAGCGAYMKAWIAGPSMIAARIITVSPVSNIGKAAKGHVMVSAAPAIYGPSSHAVGERPDQRNGDHLQDMRGKEQRQDARRVDVAMVEIGDREGDDHVIRSEAHTSERQSL